MSNNFTSGMAGPAAVETLNLLWDRVTEQIVGNSTTSLAIGTGAKTLTIEASKQFAIGQTARITYNSDINKWMQGTVSAYNASTGSIFESRSRARQLIKIRSPFLEANLK